MWLSDFFLPRRNDRFLTLLRDHAAILVDAARAFEEYVSAGTPLPDKVDEFESSSAAILSQLTTSLRDAFVTPMDRQDIYGLGEAIDDMIRYIDNAAREIKLFAVQPTPQIQQMARLLKGAAEQVSEAVGSLPNAPQTAWKCAQEAQKAENFVEDCYRNALVDLFDGSDVPHILKLREVYRHLSNSADRAQSIGRLIGKIVVKAT